MSPELPWLAATFMLAAATPGPTMLLALNNGARWGLRDALPGIAGATLSDAFLIAAVGFGAGALLAQSTFWFALFKWVGVAYLLWIGLSMACDRKPSVRGSAAREAPRPPSRAVFLRSFGVAITNPKGYLFFSALLPQFIDAQAPIGPQFVAAALTCMAIDAGLMSVYAAVGAASRQSGTIQGKAWPGRLCGAVLCLLALSLAAARKPG